MGDVIGQFIAEVILGGLGKVMAAVFLPQFAQEDAGKTRAMPKGNKTAFTYERNGKRYLYGETYQLVGLLTLVACGAVLYVGLKLIP